MSGLLHTKTYSVSIITPVVMAGIERNNPELRTMSIKGMLRWWFRFYKASVVNSIHELRSKESEVFGSTEEACSFYMRINPPSDQVDAYLRMNDRSNPNIRRRAFNTNQSFTVELKYFKNISEDIENSLKLLSLFGGIGARWRRGFGSIEVKEFELKEENNLASIAKEIRSHINVLKGPNNLSGFMNISNTKLLLLKPQNASWNSWESAMNDLRENFYRSLKRNFGVPKIAYKPPNGDREVSPLIIQIKRIRNTYHGVILVWKEWNKLKEFFACLHAFENLEIEEV